MSVLYSYAPDTELVTLEAARLYLRCQGTDRDEQLQALISSYSGFVSSWCDRRFRQTTYDEQYSGTGAPDLWLNAWPVTTPFATSDSVTHAVYVDPLRRWSSSTSYAEDTATVNGYFKAWPGESQGRLTWLRGAAFSSGFGAQGEGWQVGVSNIRVIYQAGYPLASMPGAVTEAVLRLIAIAWQKTERGLHAVTSMSAQGGSVSTVVQEMPKDVTTMLMPYRKERF